jgi:hypothetical protein
MNEFPDKLEISGQTYAIDTTPLEPYLSSLDPPPDRTGASPFATRGYVATWTIHEGTLYLGHIATTPLAHLFEDWRGPVAARWFSGSIHGWRGDGRWTGYPPRKFRNDEIVLQIERGNVVGEWLLDLRDVPDQTGAELRLSLPAFLFKDGAV